MRAGLPMMALAIGIPHTRAFEGSFIDGLWAIKKPDNTLLQRMPDRPIDDARNRLALGALEKGATSLLFWDSDMRPPPGGLMRLLDRGLDIVSGLAFGRRYPHWPVSHEERIEYPDGSSRYILDVDGTKEYLNRHRRELSGMDFRGALLPDGPDAVVKRPMVGMAFTMIRCGVFEQLIPDWREQIENQRVPEWFRLFDGVAGEDAHFCKLAANAGIPSHLDRSVVVGHGYGDQNIGPLDWLGFLAYIEQLPPDEWERMAGLGLS